MRADVSAFSTPDPKRTVHQPDLVNPTFHALQQRYDELQLAIDRGLDKDHGWQELVELCQRLGRHAEAESCVRRVRDVTTRLSLLARVKRERARAEALAEPVGHAVAPAASHAGTLHDAAASAPTLREHVVDALHFLLHAQLRWPLVLCVIAFPLLVALGGMSTTSHAPWVLAAMTALPATCVAVLVGALARQALLAAIDGGDEAPTIPGFRQLLATGGAFLGDALLVGSVLLGPGMLAAALAAPAISTLVGLAFGAFLLPVAWALRQVRGDLGALSPRLLSSAMSRSGSDYPVLAGIVATAFAPALVGGLALRHQPGWLLVAALTPALVLPTLFVSRLLGTWIDAQRDRLGSLLAAPTPASG